MENIEKIIHIQKTLIVLIEKYESKTRALLECDIDDITTLVASRESILKRIGVLSDEVLKYCSEDSLVYQAFKNQCGRGELPQELLEVFDLRQEFNIYAARAHNMDPEIIEKIKINRDNLMKKIRENNSGATAKAAKYYNAGFSNGKNLYFPENKKKI